MELYYHKTGGGAEYLSTEFVECENGHREGLLGPGAFLRVDGGRIEIDIEKLHALGLELVIK